MAAAHDQFAAMNAEVATAASGQGLDDDVLPCGLRRPRKVRLVVKDGDFKAYLDTRYELQAGDKLFKGDTGPFGVIEHEVDPSTATGELRIWLDGADEAPDIWDLSFGKLAPPDTDEGVAQRLANLGYPPDPKADEDENGALAEFQDELELDVTGEMDAASKGFFDNACSKKDGPTIDAERWVPDGPQARLLPLPEEG